MKLHAKATPDEICRRINELKQEGRSWAGIYPMIRAETEQEYADSTIRSYFTTKRLTRLGLSVERDERASGIQGSPPESEGLSSAHSEENAHNQPALEMGGLSADHYERASHNGPEPTGGQLSDGRSEHDAHNRGTLRVLSDECYADSAHNPLPEGWKQQMEEIATKVCRNMLNEMNVKPIITVPEDEEVPPAPVTIRRQGRGRRQNRSYERITLTIDAELARFFKAEVDNHPLRLSAGRLMDVILWNRYGRPRLSYQESDD